MLHQAKSRVKKLLGRQLNDFQVPKPTKPIIFDGFSSQQKVYNLFVPTMKPDSIFGGIYTALLFLKEFHDKGYNVKITTFDYNLSASEKAETCHYLATRLNVNIDPSALMTIGDFKVSHPSSNEIFIATMWYTANLIRSLIKVNLFNNRQFIYFIQDYEPGFSKWSDDYADALTSYQKGMFVPVFNSKYLKDYFVQNNVAELHDYYVLKPQIQTDKLRLPSKVNDVPKLLFYGRPKRSRNLFKTGIQGLIDWLAQENPDVEIYTAGQPHDDIVFDRWTIKSLGKMDSEAYWSTLNQYDLGLSLMLSPHPSYPPLEMALSGVVAVTNRFANKDLSLLSQNIVSSDFDAESIKDALIEAYRRCKDLDTRVKSANFDYDCEGKEMASICELVDNVFA